MCLLGTRRLSRSTDTTSSPEVQEKKTLGVAADVGGHIIGWADDWETSGGTDPRQRKGLGPWLRGEKGPYDGVAASAVDRIGRNLRDVLNTQHDLTDLGRVIVTGDHQGIWVFPDDENDFTMKAWASQMELRSIQRRCADDTVRSREAGEPKQRPSYGYIFKRATGHGKVISVDLDEAAMEPLWPVVERILGDTTDTITVSTEAARLTRDEVLSPADRLAFNYGRPVKGSPWTAKSLHLILTSWAALGYLLHNGVPAIGADGQRIRLSQHQHWDEETRLALIEKTKPKRKGSRAPKSTRLLSGRGVCGNCSATLYVGGRSGPDHGWGCTARVRGIPGSQHCTPAPSIYASVLDAGVTDWFLARYGDAEVMRTVFDPGTGYAARIKTMEADQQRLREDRAAGLYGSPADTDWYRETYGRLSAEIAELSALPERPAGMRRVPSGRTIGQVWREARDDAARRELLIRYQVKVTLWPEVAEQTGPRYTVTGMSGKFLGLAA